MSVRRLLSLLMLLASLFGVSLSPKAKPVPAPAAAPAAQAPYVPGPQNRYVPKPSCVATVKPGNTTSRPEWFAWCATTHGDVTRCCFSTGAAAEKAGRLVYDEELRRQGGVLVR